MTETYMTMKEVSIKLQCSLRTVMRLVKSGKLSHVKIGKLVRIPTTSFETLMKEVN